MFPILVLWFYFTACAFAQTTCQRTLELTWHKGAPDGFERDMIFINEQFPGPALEFDQDDWVEITVVNKMPFNTSIHYHGIEQLNTPWSDGVPGISQRPIEPGQSFTYKWHANEYGTYFYHAHSRGQIEDGCYGAITIKPKAGQEKPFDKIAAADVKLLEAAEANVQPLVISDWRHTTSHRTWELEVASGFESSTCLDSLLLNGRGAVNCWSREDLDKFTSPALAPVLAANNLTMTNKGCLPPAIFPILLGGSAGINISALPKEVFEVCTPTQGSRTVVQAPPHNKWLALHLISTAGLDTIAFSIDEHPMWVFAVDGHYIEPMQVDAIVLANGERYSVFVELDKPAKNYGIRIASVSSAQLLDTTAVFSYSGAYSHDNTITSTPFINQVGGNTSSTVTFFNQSLMVSFPPEFPQPAPEVDQTLIFNLETPGPSYYWALNSSTFPTGLEDTNPPLLYQTPSAANPGGNITIVTKNNTWVDLIFQITQPSEPPHPIHKHSNKAFIIGAGAGAFNYSSVAEAQKAIPQNFNLVTPPYRDGFVTPAGAPGGTWLAVRYQVVNPGAFLLHCHIQSHLNGGMAMVILDGVDEWPQVPEDCKN